jgi:hypothetical protein
LFCGGKILIERILIYGETLSARHRAIYLMAAHPKDSENKSSKNRDEIICVIWRAGPSIKLR